MTVEGRAKKAASDNPVLKGLLHPGQTYLSVTEKITEVVLTRDTPLAWMIGFAVVGMFFMIFLLAVTYLFYKGVGIWGIMIPVAWGFAITNFVWWIGIGHAGTLISAILLLFRQEWRTSINRFAEAMTIFAVAAAGMFPILHLGRPWFAYFIMPYPNTMGIWPQWRSPLVWDLFAISTYGTVSLIFWFIGLVPDLATMRDRAKPRILKVIYGMLAMGWRGSARHWERYKVAYFLLAALATPLVVSVHSIVGLDFAYALVPGWHSTITPPFFVAGAIYSGFAMVFTLAIPLRKVFHLEGLITMKHMDYMAKVMLATGLIVAYGYGMELFMGWYSGSTFEAFLIQNRAFGPYAPWYWLLILINVVIVQALWFPQVRKNLVVLFILSIIINIGMWLERFIIIVVSLSRDFLPSAWGFFTPTIWDWAILFGSMGFFFTMMFLFVRSMPSISIFEVRELVHKSHPAEAEA
jgi:molybdopterin-containing oxidoreductase family membrane subunit